MDETPLSPARLWKRMTHGQKTAAALAFWSDEEATNDQIQAVLLIAQQKKFRPKTVVALDVDRKARQLASLVSLPEAIAARVLVLYHLAAQRPMMAAFLDALGIAHEDGLIKEEEVKPDPSKLAGAVAEIGQRFPAEDVDVYLDTLVCQDPQTWAALRSVPRQPGRA